MLAWPFPDLPAGFVPLTPGAPDRPDGSAAYPALSLYDSARAGVAPTSPGAEARMYVCGITPYDATHLGHAATYLAFDLVYRYWLAAGHRVHYVQNITDVDDPLLERAERDGVDWRELADSQIELFRADMTALRVLPPREYVGAVEAMDRIGLAVGELLKSGAAYRVADRDFPDVYFDIEAAPRFGQVSRADATTMATLFAERGGDPDRPGKRHRLDALLWRMERPGEPAWDAPMGRGRAGWHVECAVIGGDRLGMGFDVQGGGSDLIFPHHEYSAAHAESLTGTAPFAHHYTHAAMIGLAGEKMSKSRGNLVLVSALRAQGVDPMAIRLALLTGHYRVDRDFDPGQLERAGHGLASWRAAATRATGNSDPDPAADVTVAALIRALADDLDTPTAVGILDRWAAADQPTAGVADAVDALLGIRLR